MVEGGKLSCFWVRFLFDSWKGKNKSNPAETNQDLKHVVWIKAFTGRKLRCLVPDFKIITSGDLKVENTRQNPQKEISVFLIAPPTERGERASK